MLSVQSWNDKGAYRLGLRDVTPRYIMLEMSAMSHNTSMLLNCAILFIIHESLMSSD